jgi:Ino eighty subunit 2
LKKQSRPKNKRGALYNVEDRTPSTSNTKAASTPVSQSLLREALVHAAAEREGEEDMDIDNNTEMADACPVEALVPEPIPTMYRWVSSTKGFLRAGGTTGDDDAMTLIFSVPVSVTNRIANASPTEEASVLIPQKIPAVCDVEGCTQLRKYRFVKDWTKGACGMPHLKQLEVP